MLWSVFLHIVTDLIWVKLGDYNYFKPERQRHMQAGDYSVRREHRDDIQESLPPGIGHATVLEIKGYRVESVVGNHDALGRARRTAGKRYRGQIIVSVRCGLSLYSLARRAELGPCHYLAAGLDLRSRHL